MVVGCAFLFGCANREPPRPVPPPENVPEIPPWFPEKPWNEKGAGAIAKVLTADEIEESFEDQLARLTAHLEGE